MIQVLWVKDAVNGAGDLVGRNAETNGGRKGENDW